jgi:cytochrome c oxidase cbb3-type subunit I/II
MYRMRAIGGIALHPRRADHDGVNLFKTAKPRVSSSPTTEVQARRWTRTPPHEDHPWGHRWLEATPPLHRLATVAIADRRPVEMIPMWVIKSNVPTIASVKPYTPLELRGPRPLHPRRLRRLPLADDPSVPLRDRALRRILQAGEFVYDHPFLWGSKRTGPDLHRVGGKYPTLALQPHARSHLHVARLHHAALPVAADQKLDTQHCRPSIKAHAGTLGVPYPIAGIREAKAVADGRGRRRPQALIATCIAAPMCLSCGKQP